MKKIFALLTTCLLLSTPLKAEGDNPSQSGFFVGGHLGYAYLGTKMETMATLSGGVVAKAADSHYKRSHNVIGGLDLGYLALLNQRYILGGDIEVNFDNISLNRHITQNLQLYTYKASRQFNLIPSFIVGAQVHNFLKIYFKLGLAISSFSYRLTNHGDIENVVTNDHSCSLGFAPSLVHELKLSECCAASVTATYEIYEKSKTVFVSPNAEGFSEDNSILKIRPNVFSIKFGLKYYI